MFIEIPPDTSGVYRVLKSVDDEGLISSAWVLGDAGPAKRRYALTKDGKACLKRWVETLQNYRAQIDGLLTILDLDRKPLKSERIRQCHRQKG